MHLYIGVGRLLKYKRKYGVMAEGVYERLLEHRRKHRVMARDVYEAVSRKLCQKRSV